MDVKIFANMASRKWATTLLILSLSFIALMAGKLDGSVWQVISISVLGIYVAGNVAEKIKAPVAGPETPPAAEGGE